MILSSNSQKGRKQMYFAKWQTVALKYWEKATKQTEQNQSHDLIDPNSYFKDLEWGLFYQLWNKLNELDFIVAILWIFRKK